MKKQYGMVVIALISFVITQQSTYGFDELMKKMQTVSKRTYNVSLQILHECGFRHYPTYQRIATCNNALDEVNRLLPYYTSLDHELKNYVLWPTISETRAKIKYERSKMYAVSEAMERNWRPLQKKLTVAKALATQQKEMVDLFIDRCEVPSDADSLWRLKSEPKQKIDICNQVFDALEESEPKYYAAIETLLLSGYSLEEMKRFEPKRKLTENDVAYWRSLKNKQ